MHLLSFLGTGNYQPVAYNKNSKPETVFARDADAAVREALALALALPPRP